MKNSTVVNVAVLVVLLIVTAVALKKTRGDHGVKTVVMVPKGVHPYYEPCYQGFKDAAVKFGLRSEYVAPTAFELPKQVKVIEDLIARGVDGIAVSALDNEGLVPVISDAGRVGEPHLAVYSGAKAGAAGFMRAIAKAGGRFGITANCVALGGTRTPAVADLNQDGWLDVVTTSFIGENGSDGSQVYAWRGSDGSPLFAPRRTCNFMGQSHGTSSSPTVADTDGDGWPEILFSHVWEIAILNHDGTYYTDYSSPQWPGGPLHPGCARIDQPTTLRL